MDGRVEIEAERMFLGGAIRPGAVEITSEGIREITRRAAGLHFDERYTVLPGMVNAHDHLEFNSFPPLGRRGAYGDMYEWAAEIREQWESPVIRACLSISMEDRLAIGGLKNLLSGVTTVVQHNPFHDSFRRGFPVRVVRDYTWSHSLGLDAAAERTFRRTPADVPWIIHAAEGFTTRAKSEIAELESRGMIARNTVLVHALGAEEPDYRLLVRRGASVVSCPVSNLFLYGRHLDYARLPAGLRFALGSDSAASSGAGLLEDIGLVRRMAAWDEARVWASVTTGPREIFGLGSELRDLVIVRDDDATLVVRSGKPVYGDEEFRDIFDGDVRRLVVSDRPKLLDAGIRLPESAIRRAAEWTPFLRRVQLTNRKR